jgi:hypothetical protein
MAKYISKNDLPFAPAGAEVIIDRGIWIKNRGKIYKIDVLPRDYSEKELQLEIGRLISQGWIEEVKPKEIWLLFNSEDTVRAYFNNPGHCVPKDRANLRKFCEVFE